MTGRPESEALLRLTSVPGLGPVRIRTLLDHFGSATAVIRAAPDRLARTRTAPAAVLRAIRASDPAVATACRERADRVGAQPVGWRDTDYPSLLREIHDPPVLIWSRGRMPASDAACVAIVGTRRSTSYGRRMAHDLAARFVSAGLVVVSGLAYGIDAAAHQGALAAGGVTVGVLGCGIDRIYPAAHRSLATRMLERGCLLSEFAPGTPVQPGHFPKRNRIISGLCRATVVVEAHPGGGALITSKLALDQNREVYAVPGPAGRPSSAGTNALIRDGEARLLSDPDELIGDLWPDFLNSPTEAVGLTDIERRVYDAVGAEPDPIDTICVRTGLHVSDVLVHLLSLEFAGLVRQLAGKQYYRIGIKEGVRHPHQGPDSSLDLHPGTTGRKT